MGGLYELLKQGLAWLRSAPDRDVEGEIAVNDPDHLLIYRWPRWRGSVKRLADLAITFQEALGTKEAKPIIVRWSPNFTHAYGAQEFVGRVEESRLARAELIMIRVERTGLMAAFKLSAHHGEPGAELRVSGSDGPGEFDRLKEMVELGEWRPMSSLRLATIGGLAAAFAAYLTLPLPSETESLVSAGVVVVAAGSIGLLYVGGVRFFTRFLMPPLEIRSDGALALDVVSGIFRWAVAVVPATFAVLAGVSTWLS